MTYMCHIEADTYCLSSDYVILLHFVKPGHTFHGDVVTFSSARRENDFFGVSIDQLCDLLEK